MRDNKSFTALHTTLLLQLHTFNADLDVCSITHCERPRPSLHDEIQRHDPQGPVHLIKTLAIFRHIHAQQRSTIQTIPEPIGLHVAENWLQSHAQERQSYSCLDRVTNLSCAVKSSRTHNVAWSRPRKEALIVPVLPDADGRRVSAQRQVVEVDKDYVGRAARCCPLFHEAVSRLISFK